MISLLLCYSVGHKIITFWEARINFCSISGGFCYVSFKIIWRWITPRISMQNLIKVIESNEHDSCITWIAGNGTILLQNIVRHNEECVKSRVMFWSNFINMYYQGSGSSVNCCQGDGCNRGLGQNFRPRQNKNTNEQRLHLQFPGASDSSELEAASNIFQKITIYIHI